jgi:regulator of replication initiation timing
MDSTETTQSTESAESTDEHRRRGRRPVDPRARRERVAKALQELESLNLPFTMQDVADRAEVSRATLYRDAALRDLVGSRGDGPKVRPADSRSVAQLESERKSLLSERRALRRELDETKRRVTELLERCADLEREQRERPAAAEKPSQSESERIRAQAYADGFSAGTRAAMQRGGTRPGAPGAGGLSIAAARLPRASVLAARRTLARALHPDLFAQDPATQLLATEFLKQLNSLADK